jgi:hypothetical protein
MDRSNLIREWCCSEVQRYDVLKARIKSFKSFAFTASPQVARLILQIEHLLPPRSSELSGENANEAWRIVSAQKLAPMVMEDPIFRSLKGYVACYIVPPRPNGTIQLRASASRKRFEWPKAYY